MKINESYLNPTSQCHGYHESLDNNDTKTEKEPVKREQKQKISPMSTFTDSVTGANIIGIAVIASLMVGSVVLFYTYSSGISRDIQDVRKELQDDIQKGDNELKIELKNDIQNLEIELKNDIQHLEIELKNDIQNLEIELKNEIKQENQATRTEFKQEIRNVNARFDSIEKLLHILIEDKISQAEDSPPPKEELEQ